MIKALVTSGPTRERIDPVRYITNDSSGKQGHAIAAALAKKNVEVTLISGIVNIPDPPGVTVVKVESAIQMLEAVEANLPVDIAVCTAAVADWRPETELYQKIKKVDAEPVFSIRLIKNPDILATLSSHAMRPKLVIGFAAETENLFKNAHEKFAKKGCDIIVGNDIKKNQFGSDNNDVMIITNDGLEHWEGYSKEKIAVKLAKLALDSLD